MVLSMASILPSRIAAATGVVLNMISIAKTRFSPAQMLGRRCWLITARRLKESWLRISR